MVMRKHQRYFPVVDPATGALLPHFVTVANGPVDCDAVAAGNGAVLRARFEDATFFYKEDLQTPLEGVRWGRGGGWVTQGRAVPHASNINAVVVCHSVKLVTVH